MNDFNPQKIFSKSDRQNSTWYGSFKLEDHFYKWAQSAGIPKKEIEAHIRNSRGKGYDHLYASLQCIMKAHK